jgi:glycosyltransferase involved in cell wall biosynthesis
MRIAMIEPYFGGSHQAWAEGYRDHSAHDVVLFTHDARFWKWRMHGSYLTLAGKFVGHLESQGRFDLILASDMVHLPAFLGAIGPARRDAAVALYMHENQLSYPLSPRDGVDEAYAMINWGSMNVADAVFFNSRFHHRAWFDGVAGLLKRFPDYRHSELIPDVHARSSVLPVGVDLERLGAARSARTDRPLILWNQRWDFDKGPAPFAAAMIDLAATHDFAIALAGEQIGELPDFTHLQAELPDRIVHVGHAPDPEYIQLLEAADIVVSTATQEFFGIAITEAVFAGAFPLLPNRLVYPERIPIEHHKECLYEVGELASRLRWALDHPAERTAVVADLRPVMGAFDWKRVAPTYDATFEDLACLSPDARFVRRGGDVRP